jgi:hypothetical protein
MKRPKAKKQSKPRKRGFKLIERRLPHRRLVAFPQMRGRTVEKIELFTASEFHSLTISFQDKTGTELFHCTVFRARWQLF